MPEKVLVDTIREFLQAYYREPIAEMAAAYPEVSSVRVDYTDIVRYDDGLADMIDDHPERVLAAFEAAIPEVDLPVDVEPADATVRVHNLPDATTYAPGEIRSDHATDYVAVQGQLERVTTTSDLPESVAFECQRCATITRIPQQVTSGELQEPHECSGCERAGPFAIDHDAGEWTDYAKLRIQAPPDAAADAEGKLPGYVVGDLIDVGGPAGLLGRVGEPVTVSGIVRRVQQDGRNESDLLFTHLLDVRAIEFDRDDDTIDVDAHRDTFEALAAQPDAVDQFAASLAPQLHTTDAWDAAMEFAVAYLFGAPRIDVPGGPTYRGDLHFLMVSDYGMGKSTFKEDVEAYSPGCISKSTTALSSDVGLTAAAVKDDFGEGQWTIKPGLLVRANGGHLILDEIDKGPDELTNMNDALEGAQTVDIEKAGQSATYESRTAVMALGNPVDGRFDPALPVAEQLGISESLLSRFDGIVTMSDRADSQQDAAVAETWGRAYTEAQERQYGDREAMDTLDRPVPIDVGRAWIQYAREECTPILRYEQFAELKEWYAEEVRQLNHSFAGDGDGADMPVPATVRELAAAAKMAVAFARVHLRDEVAAQDVERAKKLGKRLVKQNWDGERFDAARNVNASTQQGRMDHIRTIIRKNGPLPRDEAIEKAGRAGIKDTKAEQAIDKLLHKGELYRPGGELDVA